MLIQLIKVRVHGADGVGIVFFPGQGQEFFGVAYPPVQVIYGIDDLFQRGPFPAQGLGPLGVFPEGFLLQFAVDFYQAFRFVIEFKDTSSRRRYGLLCP